MAVVLASAVCEYVTEEIEDGKDGEALVAICTAKRRGYPKPTVVRFSVADAKKAGLWAKGGPWTQYPRRMLQLRARGFALRDAFPDVLKGLVTAEEAQDYQSPEPAREPVMVRPQGQPARLVKSVTEVAPGMVVAHVEKFERPADERADPFDVAQAAIEAETDIGKLDAMRGRIDTRLQDKTFTAFQADALLDQIHARVEFLEAEQEVAK